MPTIIIPSTKSITVTNEIPNSNLKDGEIIVGCNEKYKYSSFLFFDLSSLADNIAITNAELILFKTDNFYEDKSTCFCINPLYGHFSSFTTYKNQPLVNHFIQKKFYPLTSNVDVKIDITDIVNLWYKNKLPNKGIIIYSNRESMITKFGSAISEDKYLIPFIEVKYVQKDNLKDNQHKGASRNEYEKHCPVEVVIQPCCCNNCNNSNNNNNTVTIRQINVKGTIAANTKYVIVLELLVRRGSSGIVDSYYVTDEYDNLFGDAPLDIDKAYNISVVPKEEPNDIETLKYYGAYKSS